MPFANEPNQQKCVVSTPWSNYLHSGKDCGACLSTGIGFFNYQHSQNSHNVWCSQNYLKRVYKRKIVEGPVYNYKELYCIIASIKQELVGLKSVQVSLRQLFLQCIQSRVRVEHHKVFVLMFGTFLRKCADTIIIV